MADKNSWFMKACFLVFALGMLNFLTFVAGAIYLGGDAVNGKMERGRYYVFGVRAESGHKIYTEVSEKVFCYSRWHAYTNFVTWPLVMAAGFLANRQRRA